jgi:hypothetical protein
MSNHAHFLLRSGPGGIAHLMRRLWQSIRARWPDMKNLNCKGITDIDLPIEVTGAVLAEIPAYTEWFFQCLQAEKVPQISSTAYNLMVYIALEAPWPLNRLVREQFSSYFPRLTSLPPGKPGVRPPAWIRIIPGPNGHSHR